VRTLEQLAESGLRPTIERSAPGPLGPLLRARAPMLAARGLIDPETLEENLVAIRADTPDASSKGGKKSTGGSGGGSKEGQRKGGRKGGKKSS